MATSGRGHGGQRAMASILPLHLITLPGLDFVLCSQNSVLKKDVGSKKKRVFILTSIWKTLGNECKVTWKKAGCFQMKKQTKF